jgi:hypothetical protein
LLADAAVPSAPTGISADGKTIVGHVDGQVVVWRWILRSGHPAYKLYPFALKGFEKAEAVSTPPGGGLLAANLTGSHSGYVQNLTSKAALIIHGARLTAITLAHVVLGVDESSRPMKWFI